MKCEALLCLCFLLPLVTDLCWGLIHAKACNRTIRTSVGWIRWTGRMGRCVVRIRAPLRDPQVVELRIRRLQVGTLRDSTCEGAYVQFSDGIEDLEDDVGRYCGHVTGNATRLFLRKGPELSIVMDSETKFAAENPVIFSAQFSVLPARLAIERHGGSLPSAAECSLDCSNQNYQRQCRITSPGFPGIYPRGMRCRISLESTAGRFKIGGINDDVFNLMNYTVQDGCRTENCEDHVEEDMNARIRTENVEDEEEEEEEEGKEELIVTEKIRHARNLPSIDYRFDEDDEMIIVGSDVKQKRIEGREKKWNKNDGEHGGPRMGDSEDDHKSGKRRKSKNKTNRKESGHIHSRKFSAEGYFQRDRKGGKKSPSFQSERNLKSLYDDSREEKGPEMYEENGRGGGVIGVGGGIGSSKKTNSIFDHRFHRKHKSNEKFEKFRCVSDYLAIYENMNGKIVEISKFCGEGHIPEIISRGRNVIVEFTSRRDGTIMHDGFQLTLQEMETEILKHPKNCEFIYKSSDRGTKENIKSFQHWYPPSTLCSYKFVGKTNEKIFVQLKIVRNEFDHTAESNLHLKQNLSLNYCPGNEIAVYNGAFSNDSLAWSYCDVLHSDINNIQVPVTSTGNILLVQYYSSKGSLNGLEFTYSISYKFVKRPQNGTKRKSIAKLNETKTISLKPVNFSALNLTEYENCNCDFSSRIGTFKSWFIVLVVLGVISFLGAVLTIVALLMKCLKIRSMENKLLQTPKR